VTAFRACQQAQSAEAHKAAHGVPRRAGGESDPQRQPQDGKPQPDLPFEPAMPQEMGIGRAVNDRQAQPRDQQVFKLFPDFSGIADCVFHDGSPERKLTVDS
jgi:hypothetical protein